MFVKDMPGDSSKGKMSRRRGSLEMKVEEEVELTLYDSRTGKKRKEETAVLDEASSTSEYL